MRFELDDVNFELDDLNAIIDDLLYKSCENR